MRTEGTPLELQRRRQLAVRRVAEGYSTEEVADFLDVAPRSVLAGSPPSAATAPLAWPPGPGSGSVLRPN